MSDRTPGLGGTAPVRAVRRVLAPAALELGGQVHALQERIDQLAGTVRALEADNAALREQVRSLQESSGADLELVRGQLAELTDGLHEQRRLQLRVAEVTDLVTELVLPLHDREVDPAVLGRLRPDTL